MQWAIWIPSTFRSLVRQLTLRSTCTGTCFYGLFSLGPVGATICQMYSTMPQAGSSQCSHIAHIARLHARYSVALPLRALCHTCGSLQSCVSDRIIIQPICRVDVYYCYYSVHIISLILCDIYAVSISRLRFPLLLQGNIMAAHQSFESCSTTTLLTLYLRICDLFK